MLGGVIFTHINHPTPEERRMVGDRYRGMNCLIKGGQD